jgi:hypothetical protein
VDKGNSWEKGRAPISGSSPNFVVTALVRKAHPDGWFMEAQIPDNPLVFVGMRYLLLAISGLVQPKARETKRNQEQHDYY